MKRSEILLDTNIYFRFARAHHPLLPGYHQAGKYEYLFTVLPDVQGEFQASNRLKNKFSWVLDPEYVENREDNLCETSGLDQSDIDVTLSYLDKQNTGNASKVDLKVLVCAYLLEIGVATDEYTMGKVGKEYLDLQMYDSLDLLGIMYESGVEFSKIQETVAYWEFYDDLPWPDFLEDFERAFGKL